MLVTTILTSESLVDATNAATSLLKADRNSYLEAKLRFWNPADVQRIIDYLATAEIVKEQVFIVWVPIDEQFGSTMHTDFNAQTSLRRISRSILLFNLLLGMPTELPPPLARQIKDLQQAYREQTTGPITELPGGNQVIARDMWRQPFDITHVVQDTYKLTPNTIQAWPSWILSRSKSR